MSDLKEMRREVRQRLIKENEFPHIPDDWGVERLRFLFTESKERNGKSPVGDVLSVSEYRGVVPREYEHEEQRRTDEELENYRVVRPGQLAVNSMWLNHLGLGVSEHTGHVSPAYNVYDVSDRLDRRFVHHLMRSNYYLKIYLRYLYGIRPNSFQIKSNDWASIPIIVPDLATQRQIADFLDRETARIDLLIEKKQRLVALLGEKEGTAICDLLSASSQGMTDKKRSCLPWELELPAAWQEQTLKQTAQVIDCKHTTPVYVDDGYPLISTGEVKPYSISFVSNRQVSEDDYKNMIGGGRKPAHDDIIYSRNASVGSAAMVRDLDPFCMGQDICLIRPNNIHPQFLEHQLNCKILHLQLEPLLVGSTLKRINVNQIKNFSIIVPPRDVQHAIASEIDQLRDRTRRTTNATLQSIDRLKEYRSALITAAVTGQIDVASYAKSGTPDRRLDAIQEEMQA